MQTLLHITLATQNPNKVAEITAIAIDCDWPVVFYPLPGDVLWDETADTFAENALIKAKEAAKIATTPFVLAEDSGMIVEALTQQFGWPYPGVKSNRWLTPQLQKQLWGSVKKEDPEALSWNDKNHGLLQLMQGQKNRKAHYVACAVLLETNTGKVIAQEEARLELCLIEENTQPRGTNGFGFDPIVCLQTPPNAISPNTTLAQLGTHEKNALSHRKKALNQLFSTLL